MGNSFRVGADLAFKSINDLFHVSRITLDRMVNHMVSEMLGNSAAIRSRHPT